MGLPKTFPPATFWVEMGEYNTGRSCSEDDCRNDADYHACIPTDQETGWFAWCGYACVECLAGCNFVGDPPAGVGEVEA